MLQGTASGYMITVSKQATEWLTIHVLFTCRLIRTVQRAWPVFKMSVRVPFIQCKWFTWQRNLLCNRLLYTVHVVNDRSWQWLLLQFITALAPFNVYSLHLFSMCGLILDVVLASHFNVWSLHLIKHCEKIFAQTAQTSYLPLLSSNGWHLKMTSCQTSASALWLNISRVGQNRISAPHMTVCMVISLLKIPYVHRIYL